VKEWLTESGATSLIIPTGPFHSRRVRRIFRQILGNSTQLTVRSIRPETCQDWWQHESTLIDFPERDRQVRLLHGGTLNTGNKKLTSGRDQLAGPSRAPALPALNSPIAGIWSSVPKPDLFDWRLGELWQHRGLVAADGLARFRHSPQADHSRPAMAHSSTPFSPL